MRSGKFIAAAALFVGSVWAANWLTATYGQWEQFGLIVTWGTFAAGFTLVARDMVNEWGGRPAVYLLIALGALLSALLDPMLALASGVAFAASELVDTLIYERVRAREGIPWAILCSGAVAAPVDTALFFWLAPEFIQSPPGAWAGQLAVKIGISAVAAGLAVWVARRR
jgi:uncharacterized PurR-regulated membrane protein YhhQ (DUF165 family)